MSRVFNIILNLHDGRCLNIGVDNYIDISQILDMALMRYNSFDYEVTHYRNDEDLPFNDLTIMKGWCNKE